MTKRKLNQDLCIQLCKNFNCLIFKRRLTFQLKKQYTPITRFQKDHLRRLGFKWDRKYEKYIYVAGFENEEYKNVVNDPSKTRRLGVRIALISPFFTSYYPTYKNPNGKVVCMFEYGILPFAEEVAALVEPFYATARELCDIFNYAGHLSTDFTKQYMKTDSSIWYDQLKFFNSFIKSKDEK